MIQYTSTPVRILGSTSVFNLAKSSWGMESLKNPVENITSRPKTEERIRRFENDEEERTMAAAKSHKKLTRIIRFAVETAMRLGEIAALEWRYVDLTRSTVYLPRTKNDEERTVPLSPIALNILKEIALEKGDSDNVFGMKPKTITKAFIRVRDRAGVEDFHFHDLRHEATSRLFENTDLDIMEIKSITGHKTLQMLARYAHLRTHRLVARLAGAKRGEPVYQ